MSGWTRANIKHLALLFRSGRRPAVTVYESLGDELWLAPAPGWLNLGYWAGDGTEDEAEQACARLVELLADPLPRDGVTLDVANGLGAQDAVIAGVVRPRVLVALNITEFQLRAGLHRLEAARALPLNADAMAIPLRDGSVDGIISVEAAFHFPSRERFFAEAMRVLRPGGVLSISDISVERFPRRPGDIVAGAFQARFWGIRRRAMQSAGEIVAAAEAAGFVDVRAELCAARTIDPALRLTEGRLQRRGHAPRLQHAGARWALRGIQGLRARGILQYVLLRATKPA